MSYHLSMSRSDAILSMDTVQVVMTHPLYTSPLPTLNHISSHTKKLFGIYWFHYSSMVNDSDLGEVANWKGGRGGTLPK